MTRRAGGALPIHDEAHVRNALARFDRVDFEDEAAREQARRRLLNAARRFGILPVGFVAAQLRPDRGSPDFSKFPTGSVTFLMTDIERSTRLAERLGDQYAALLKDVRALVRDAGRRRGGRRVDSHGDEYLTVFETPKGAIEAAIEIQRSLAVRRWPGKIGCPRPSRDPHGPSDADRERIRRYRHQHRLARVLRRPRRTDRRL